MTSAVARIELPGIGVRSTLSTNDGVEVGILEYNSGGKELLVYSQDDPDQCASVLKLDAAEAQALADLLGVTEAAGHDTLRFGSLIVKSIVVGEGSNAVGQPMARSDAAVSVIGVVRNSELLPTSEALLKPGDVVIVAGNTDAVAAAVEFIGLGP